MISEIESLKNLDNVLKYLEANRKRAISLEELQKACESYIGKIEVAMIMGKLEDDGYIDVEKTPTRFKEGALTIHGMLYIIRINYNGLTFHGYKKQARRKFRKELYQDIKDWILIIATCVAAVYGLLETYKFFFPSS